MTPAIPNPLVQRSPPLVAEHDILPAGTRFGEFEIIRMLGVGGFGIVYLAQDHSLERLVALKEYMPASLAARGEGPAITVRSGAFVDTYAMGLRSFINEARLLARFDHPSLVKVYRFWEDNATAYMVMPYLQGITLRELRHSMSESPNEAWIRALLDPLLSALDLLHREGVYHRDIAPDNILLPPEMPPILLDFGAARRVISDRTQSLTAILKPSYAPIEQYAEMTQLRQGPWTDLYALGAVIHFLLFGQPPAPATARAVQDENDHIAQRDVVGVSPRFIAVVGWMLAVRPNERPQSVDAVRAALDGRLAVPEPMRREVTMPIDTAPVSLAATPYEATMLMAASDSGSGPAALPRLRLSPAPPPSDVPGTGAGSRRQRRLMAVLAGVAVLLLASFWFVIGERRTQPVVSEAASAVALPASAVAEVAASSTRAMVVSAVDAGASQVAAQADSPVATGAMLAPVVASAIASAPAATASAVKVKPSARTAYREVDVATSAALTAEAAPAVPVPRRAKAAATEARLAPAEPATAREACGNRSFIALAVCIDRECEQPRYRDHPECQRVLAMKRKREQQ